MANRKIGFTGTQVGMTLAQELCFRTLIKKFNVSEFHHGDCLGADKQAHQNARWYSEALIFSHPPINEIKRAFCKADVVLTALDYLVRNKEIVENTQILFACPKSKIEELRSGTWSTVRYARKVRREIYLIYPDGSFDHEAAK